MGSWRAYECCANLSLFAYKPVKPIHVFIARTLLEFCIYFVIFITVLFFAGWFFRLDVFPVHLLGVLFCIFLLICSAFALGICFFIGVLGLYFPPG